jgi:hypothetical protein
MLPFGTHDAIIRARENEKNGNRKEIAMKNETIKTGMKMGAVTGGLVFLVFGILPGFYFGSYGTLILLQKLMGGAVEPTLFVRAAIVMGIGVGIAAAAAVSLVVGGLLGTATGYIVSAPSALFGKQTADEV